jgi:23S rRNA (uracil1939-C5)-methyltransferase/tRNA (uracil-5-)-methyltransferase
MLRRDACVMILLLRVSTASAWTTLQISKTTRTSSSTGTTITTASLSKLNRLFLSTRSVADEHQYQFEQEQETPSKVPRKFIPYPFPYREEKTLRVDSLTNMGVGVCRVKLERTEDTTTTAAVDEEQQREWVIFVPNVIPGEIVRMRIYRNHKAYSEADLLEIVEPSPSRVQPLCKLAEICGGCQYQHMDIASQRDWKTRQVEELLERIADLPNVEVSPTVGTDETFHYRSKITPHYEQPERDGPNKYKIGNIGFKQKSSRHLVDVDYCHIATEAINERLATLREERRDEAQANELKKPKKGATLLLRDAAEGVVTDHNVYVTTTVKDLTFRFLAGNFFQNNPFMLPVMVDHVVAAAIKPADGGRKMTHLIDCYCGSGLFCLTSAHAFDTCVGIEVNPLAIEEARANAALNSISNCAFVAASAEAIFESDELVQTNTDTTTMSTIMVRDFPRHSTVVVCDPPRKGCSEEFLQQLYEFQPQRIVYMSCDPATQARDSHGIVANGYEITSTQPFDLFPQTRHIECLITFEKKAPI